MKVFSFGYYPCILTGAYERARANYRGAGPNQRVEARIIGRVVCALLDKADIYSFLDTAGDEYNFKDDTV